MNPDDAIAERLRAVPMPADLVPPQGFADEALRRRARDRGRVTVAGIVAVVAVLAGSTALIGGGPGVPPADPAPSGSSSTLPDDAVPHPGGGPRVIHSYSDGGAAYLLDLRTGEYRGVPFQAETSPDERFVLVDAIDRFGVAERDAYLDEGAAAVAWVGEPGVTRQASRTVDAWSPDGTKVFGGTSVTVEDGSDRLVSLTGYEVGGGLTWTVPVPELKVVGSAWAPDSRNFVLAVERDDGSAYLQNLSTEGVLGTTVDLEGDYITFYGFSPDGSRALYSSEYSQGDESGSRTFVLELASGETALRLENDRGEAAHAVPVGWIDDDAFAQQVQYREENRPLEAVDAVTGEIIRTITWPTPNLIAVWSVGSSAGLPPDAADLGF